MLRVFGGWSRGPRDCRTWWFFAYLADNPSIDRAQLLVETRKSF